MYAWMADEPERRQRSKIDYYSGPMPAFDYDDDQFRDHNFEPGEFYENVCRFIITELYSEVARLQYILRQH